MKGHEIQWNLGLETSLGRNGWGFEIQGVHYIQLNLYHNPRYGYRYLVLHQGRALNPRLLNPASTVLCQKAVAENASIFIRGHSCLWKDGRKHSHFYRGKVTDGLWSGQGLKDISNHGCVKLKLSRQITEHLTKSPLYVKVPVKLPISEVRLIILLNHRSELIRF